MDPVPILLDEERVGELSVRQEGLYTRFDALCRGLGQAPQHLSAVGALGSLRLGVPEPDGSVWRLRRRISNRDLSALGELRYGELRPCGEDTGRRWEQAPYPEQLFRGAFLRDRLRGSEGVLTRQEDGVRFLAVPYDRRRPFLLTSLFCFASVRPIGGKPYAVFCFDRGENPVFRR